MTDKLPYAAVILVIAGIVLADIAIEGSFTGRGLALIIAVLLVAGLAVVVGRSGASRARHEKRWKTNREGPWRHRKEGDPR